LEDADQLRISVVAGEIKTPVEVGRDAGDEPGDTDNQKRRPDEVRDDLDE
jgi:hypothetical protein